MIILQTKLAHENIYEERSSIFMSIIQNIPLAAQQLYVEVCCSE